MTARRQIAHSVRLAGPADAKAIAIYHHRCWVQAFAHLVNPGVVEQMDPLGKLDRWQEWLDEGSDFRTLVVVMDNAPVGHATVRDNELVHLFIDPDHWGKGLGRLLLVEGEKMLQDTGHRTAILHTMVGNAPAIALYESAGWVVTDKLVHNDVDGVVYDEHELVKRFDI